MKNALARAILKWYLPRFLRDAIPFNRLLGQSIKLQLGQITDEAFRVHLDDFYRGLEVSAIKQQIDLKEKMPRLNRPDGYKVDILNITCTDKAVDGRSRFNLWERRFGLLRRLGIRSDVLILREGEVIPPHGHCRVVSGFYVLEGRVAARHYDRVKELGEKLLIRKVLDTELGPGGFTTNSEFFQNIHWLQGLASESYLFRVTVTDTPTPTFGGRMQSDSRLYIDPTGVPDDSGLILGTYVDEERAKSLLINARVTA